MIQISGFLFAIASIIVSTIKYRVKIEDNLFKYIFRGHSKLDQLAMGARIAKFAILLSKFLSQDLINGNITKLDNLENYLINNMGDMNGG